MLDYLAVSVTRISGRLAWKNVYPAIVSRIREHENVFIHLISLIQKTLFLILVLLKHLNCMRLVFQFSFLMF